MSRQPTDRRPSTNSIISPTTPKRSEIPNQVLSPQARFVCILPKKLDTLLNQAKFDLEEIYYTSEGLWAFKRRVSEAFDLLRKTLSEVLQQKLPNKLQTTPEVKGIIKDLNKSKGTISSLNKDLEKKIPLLSEYERKLRELTTKLDLEKSKNSELSFRLSKIENEKETLMNSGNSLMHNWKNNSKDSKDILEITNLSPLSTPKGSIFSRQHKTLSSPRLDQEENSFMVASLLRDNEELKKNLDLIIHNYDNLCGKMKIQNEDFHKFKEWTQESQFFNEIQIKDQFFDLYFKVCPEEENRLRFNSQFLASPQVFFAEVLNKYEKLKENFEIRAFLLEKSQEENKNLLSKVSADQDFCTKKESELRGHFLKELDMKKCEILRQKGKKRELKARLNETINNYQIKYLESQSLAEELSLAQSHESKVNEQVKDKKREILVIEQENKVKTEQIQDLKMSLKQKEIELQDVKGKLGKVNKSENDKDNEIYSQQSLIDSLQSQLKAMKKLVEDTESRENHLEYSLRIREAELKGVESKLALQMSINDRLKDSHSATKAEILKKYNEKLEEKEKLFQELQELNENLSRKLDSTHKTVQNMHEQSQIKDFERSLSVNQELNDCKLMLQGLISKLSTKTGENIIEPVSGLRDSIRVVDSLMIIIINQLDSTNNQVKLIKAEMNKLQEDLHRGQMTIQELTIKSSAVHSHELNSEHIKYLLKEKCNNRKLQINSLETQLKEKETVHQQGLLALKEKFRSKKQKLNEKIRLREIELNDIKKQLSDSSSKRTENVSTLIENEKNLKTLLDQTNSNLEKALEQNSCFKKQHEEDETLIYKQNKYILKLEQQKETLQHSESSLKAERASILLENSEKLKALQDNLAEMHQIKRQETDEGSLESDEDENVEVKISKLFKQLQEKEYTIKKANKRIMELQWAQRDVIDQCKENEEKMLATVETNEKMTEENDKLSEQLSNLNEKIRGLESEIEEFKERVKEFKENESRFKGFEASLQDNIEELKIKIENNEDE